MRKIIALIKSADRHLRRYAHHQTAADRRIRGYLEHGRMPEEGVDDILAGGSATDPFVNDGKPTVHLDPFSGAAPKRTDPAATDPFKM